MSYNLIETSKAIGRTLFAVVCIVLAIAVFVAIDASIRNADKQKITKWAVQREFKVVSVSIPFTHPFWFVDDNDRVYYVTLDDNGTTEHVYFKFGLFGMSESWENKLN